METVISRDGTSIAFSRSGVGPPLVLVHGSTADHTRWALVRPELERAFTVFAMDRRGRGGSGDADTYSLERNMTMSSRSSKPPARVSASWAIPSARSARWRPR
jgi:pimeloyl-ACP methyl ester carboxylesterase